MDRLQPIDTTQKSSRRGEQAKLVGLAALLAAAGSGLAMFAGPPRIPSAPRLDDALQVLSGASLPLQPIALLLVDVAWLLWAWSVLSLALELVVAGAEFAARGRGWVLSLRAFADRVSVPLVRRAVAGAFVVQIISRGVPVAAAQTLPPPQALVAEIPAAVERIRRSPPTVRTIRPAIWFEPAIRCGRSPSRRMAPVASTAGW